MRGKHFFVAPSFLIVLGLLFWKSKPWDVLLFLGAVLLHETGHFLCLFLFDRRVQGFTLSLSGAQLVTASPYLSYKKEATVYLAGPLANAMACTVTTFFLRQSFTKSGVLFFSFNFLLGILNLLPIKGLDGGGILYSLLCLYGEEHKARQITDFCHVLTLAGLTLFSIWLVMREKNPSLLILSVSLWAEGAEKEKKPR